MSIKIEFDSNSIKRVEAQTKLAFEKVISSKKLLDEVGKTVVTDIQFQTRRGQSIPENARLKPLSSRWIKDRQLIADATDTNQVYSPKRSNLTLTGQLLDALSWRIVTDKKGTIETFFKGIRRPYFRKSKRTGKVTEIKTKISNEELAEYVQRDRPFVGVRDQVVRRIKNIVISYLRRSSRVLNLFD
jgi:hypothetical protein